MRGSSLIATGLLVFWSSTALAQPAADQVQTQTDDQSQTTVNNGPASQRQDETSQGQSLGSTPAPGPGGIIFQPQIQVQVQPQIDVSAQPKADANANANVNATSDADANANADVDAKGEISTKVDTSGRSDHAGAWPTHTHVVHRPVPRAQPAPPAPVFRPHTKRRKGLMIAGWVTFAAVYAGTAYNAAWLYDNCDHTSDFEKCRDLSRAMFVPIAGPFIAIQHADTATNQFKLSLLGAGQSAGALMGLIGTVMYVRDGHRNRVLNEHGVRVAKDVRLGPDSGPAHAGFRLTYRF